MCPSALPTLYFTNCISLRGGLFSHCFYALYFIPLWEDIWGGIWREALGDNPSRLDQRHPPLPRISLPSRISYKHQQLSLQQQLICLYAWGHLDEEALVGTLLESGEFAWHCFLQNIGFIWKMSDSYEKCWIHIKNHKYVQVIWQHILLQLSRQPRGSWLRGRDGLWPSRLPVPVLARWEKV